MLVSCTHVSISRIQLLPWTRLFNIRRLMATGKLQLTLFRPPCLSNLLRRDNRVFAQKCHLRLKYEPTQPVKACSFNAPLSPAWRCLVSPASVEQTLGSRAFLIQLAGTQWRNLHSSSAVRAGLPTEVSRDVLLFEHERTTFFRLLGFFCLGQFIFWTYLAHFAFTTLKDTGFKDTVIVGDEGKNLPKLGGISLNLGSNKWRYGFTASCFTVGSLILAAGVAFARRSVSRVVLRKGGQEVHFSTYYPFGMKSEFTVPLRHVSSVAHRAEVPSMIPVKIKGHPLYYLLDKQGQLYNPKLFDLTVGAYRKL
ncbi:transmembrane protein 223 [Erpetoichthys calabaricus]|uniref:Transmembrane protein 223 n=1 Tax=Erpetoichthys calabaricus TaxID=27687 RepID=A0A8C4X4C5_ERPCA|nr:transmembrane protein 223 [Erpetoichthys calabaricus]